MSDYCFDAAHGDVVEPKSVCPWCLRERIAELEEVAEAAEVYSDLSGEGTRDEIAAYFAASDKLDNALRAAGYLKDHPNA